MLLEDSGLLLKKADLAERSMIYGGLWVEADFPHCVLHVVRA